MQASVHTSQQSRQDAMMLCKTLGLLGSYKAWMRALDVPVTGVDVLCGDREVGRVLDL